MVGSFQNIASYGKFVEYNVRDNIKATQIAYNLTNDIPFINNICVVSCDKLTGFIFIKIVNQSFIKR